MANDIETTVIKLQEYKIDANGNWEADVIFEITDHFGLDKRDVLKFQGKERGFVTWWTLQFRRNYKPILTKNYYCFFFSLVVIIYLTPG